MAERSQCSDLTVRGLELRAYWSLLYFSNILSTSTSPNLGSRPGGHQSALLQHFHGCPCDDRGLPVHAGGERRACHQQNEGRATNKGVSITDIIMGGISILLLIVYVATGQFTETFNAVQSS